MIDLQIVSDFVHENFVGVSVSKNGTHFLARCALCGDSKKNPRKRRFNLDYNGGNPMYHCFNCDESGSFLQLYGLLNGMTQEEAKKELFGFDIDRITHQLSSRKREKLVKEIQYENHNWIFGDCYMAGDEMDGIISTSYIKTLQMFIEDRKIPNDYLIMIAHKGDYKGRIIIPVFDENRDIVYFQARRIPGSDVEPKYKNPTLEKGNVILNKTRFEDDKYVIVTEGLIDAFMLGKQGTTPLGVSFSEEFLYQLFKMDKKVIVAFDNDEVGYKAMARFMMGYKKRKKGQRFVPPNKFHKRVKYFLYPKQFRECKDINKIRTTFNISDMYSVVVDNSYSYSSAYALLRTDKALKNCFKSGGNSVNEANKYRHGFYIHK